MRERTKKHDDVHFPLGGKGRRALKGGVAQYPRIVPHQYTPRTDSHLKRGFLTPQDAAQGMVDFARELERENAALREENEALRQQVSALQRECAEIVEECATVTKADSSERTAHAVGRPPHYPGGQAGGNPATIDAARAEEGKA